MTAPKLEPWTCDDCGTTVELLAASEAHHTCPQRGGKRVPLHLAEKDQHK